MIYDRIFIEIRAVYNRYTVSIRQKYGENTVVNHRPGLQRNTVQYGRLRAVYGGETAVYG